MEPFDFNAQAELFSGDRRRNKRLAMQYRRFDSGAEAVRFAVEGQAAERLRTTIIEADDVRIEADEISRLYASDAYPFERRPVPAAQSFDASAASATRHGRQC